MRRRTIVCYGDSNTWGVIAGSPGGLMQRYPWERRWPGVLQEVLGERFRVIEEGLRGRTTELDDPVDGGHKNGLTYLLPCLESHQPINWVVIFLGINDLKARFGRRAEQVASGIETLIGVVLTSSTGPNRRPPEVLAVSPPPISPRRELLPVFGDAQDRARGLEDAIQRVSERRGVACLRTSGFLQPNARDGIHLDEEGHRLLGERISSIIAGCQGRHAQLRDG